MKHKEPQLESGNIEQEILRPEFEELENEPGGEKEQRWNFDEADVVEGLNVGIGVSIGSCQMRVKDLMALTAGDHITLDKSIDAPVDLLVEGRIVGQGELVVVGDKFGVRLLQIANRKSN